MIILDEVSKKSFRLLESYTRLKNLVGVKNKRAYKRNIDEMGLGEYEVWKKDGLTIFDFNHKPQPDDNDDTDYIEDDFIREIQEEEKKRRKDSEKDK